MELKNLINLEKLINSELANKIVIAASYLNDIAKVLI